MSRRTRAALVALSAFAAVATVRGAEAPPVLRPWALLTHHLYEGDLGEPRAVAVDRARGEIWVADSRTHSLAAFTPEGVPLFTSSPTLEVREPARIAVDRRGRLLVLDDDRSRIKVLSYRGEYVGDLALPGLPEHPTFGAIAFDAEGNLYVGENESGQVLVFGPDLKPRLRFGSPGTDDTQFQSIGGIAADSELIFVVDHQSTPVQAFDHRGNLVRAWGRHDMGAENFSLPEAVALDSKGHVVVVDALRHEIKLFDREGRFLDRFGGFGSHIGQVSFPMDVAVDAADRVYVVERGNARVQVFVFSEPTPARPR
jgi:DNA-binding beta-propeller fold protein YncE